MSILPPGERIGDYSVIRYVSSGAMSDVYEARHALSGHPVAMKVLLWSEDPEVKARFLNESGSLQEIKHARIITVFAVGALPDGAPFMALEWMPLDLHQALSRAAGPLPLSSALRIAEQLAEALAALHERDIIHRDLKPANVLLTHEDLSTAEIKLTDLGLAKIGSSREGHRAQHVSTANSKLLGTGDYRAPEQWISPKNVDPKADVYSLGVLLFQMLIGRLPFINQEKDLMESHLFLEPPFHLLDGLVSTGLRDLVEGMLAKKAPARPTTREARERLGALCEL
jgi:eukaryotic-like serine/threonine-protein kinase